MSPLKFSLNWTAQASADIARLHRYLCQKGNFTAAARAVKPIRAEVKKLQQNPYIGLPFFDLPKEYRRWPIRFGANGGYVALFRMEGECISILAVKHALERDFRNMEDIRQKTGGDTGKRAGT